MVGVILPSPSSDEKCAGELNGWNLMFDDKLVQYDARVLPAEPIWQKDSKVRGGEGEEWRGGTLGQ